MPLNLNSASSNELNKKEIIWRPVQATGRFLNQYQILLDNQVEKTKAGYYVYTPFSLEQSDITFLVNRGWLSAGDNRKSIPDLTLTNDITSIIAVAKEVPKTGLLLKDMPPEQMSESVYRVQQINLEELEGLTKTKLSPFIIRLLPESAHGYGRQWRLPGSGQEKRTGCP